MLRVRFTQAAWSKHRIAPSRARRVMATTIGRPIATKRGDPGILWVGRDREGNVLEIIAARDGEDLIVVHVMPYKWKKRS